MRKLFKLTQGYETMELMRTVEASRFRITMFNYTCSGASTELVHVILGNHAQNYDETNDKPYSIAFVALASSTVQYTPITANDSWYDLPNGNLSTLTVQVHIDNTLAGSLTAQNVYLEIEYE